MCTFRLNGSMRPSKASKETAAMMSASQESFLDFISNHTAYELMNWVPFSRAKPSLDCRVMGSQPNFSLMTDAGYFLTR